MPPRRRSLGPLVVLAVCLTATGCRDGGDDETDSTAGEETGVLDLAVGTCLQVPPDTPAEISELPVVDCDVPHTHEVYAVLTYPDEVYPGVDALQAFAQPECVTAFQRYVGISPFDSTLNFSWLVPTLDSWNDHDDRDVLCVLSPRDTETLTGSKKDARV